MKNRINQVVTSAGVVGASFMPVFAQADFVSDSKAALELKNYYFNRDYRESSGQNKREEWAQGFILNVESGFTEGTVGFGLDVVGMLGLKLDSSPDNSGTGLLARSSVAEPGAPSYARRAHDNYSKLGITGKALLLDRRENEKLAKAARNNPALFVEDALGLDAYSALEATTLILTEQALKTVTEVLG